MGRGFQRRRVLPPPRRPWGQPPPARPLRGWGGPALSPGEGRSGCSRRRGLFTAWASSPPAHLGGQTLRCGLCGRGEAGSCEGLAEALAAPVGWPACQTGLNSSRLSGQCLLPAVRSPLIPRDADPPPQEGVEILSASGNGRETQVMWPSEGWAAAGQVWRQPRRGAKLDSCSRASQVDVLYWAST